MHTHRRLIPTTLILALLLGLTAWAQHPAMPAGMTHEEHLRHLQEHADLKQRGAAAMGFDQDATAHHFILTAGGGRIAVTANNPSDLTSPSRVAGDFASGGRRISGST